jgi:NADH/NAD ratio-sensing transcriptional regulator Rex
MPPRRSKSKGIWNFFSIQLEVPENIIVQNVDLAQSLGVLSHSIARANG